MRIVYGLGVLLEAILITDAQSVPLKNMTDSVKVCVYMRR